MLDVLRFILLCETDWRPGLPGHFPNRLGRLHHSLLPLPPGPRLPSECVRHTDYNCDPAEHVHHGENAPSEMAIHARGGPIGTRKERTPHPDEGKAALRK